MRAIEGGAVLLATAFAAVVACSSGAAKYPACQTDAQCAVGGKHDYCVDGHCAYCRTSVDCGDRERCRAGACEPDPNAPPVPEAGADAEADAASEGGQDEEEGSEADPEAEEQTRMRSRVRALERRVRTIRTRQHRP